MWKSWPLRTNMGQSVSTKGQSTRRSSLDSLPMWCRRKSSGPSSCSSSVCSKVLHHWDWPVWRYSKFSSKLKCRHSWSSHIDSSLRFSTWRKKGSKLYTLLLNIWRKILPTRKVLKCSYKFSLKWSMISILGIMNSKNQKAKVAPVCTICLFISILRKNWMQCRKI